VRRIRDDQNPVQPVLDLENHHAGARMSQLALQINYGPIKQCTTTMQDGLLTLTPI
jgi:hypothetical protein